MRVFVKFNIGTKEHGLPPLMEGEHDVDDAVGKELVKRRLAVMLGVSEPAEIQGVPPVVEAKADDEPAAGTVVKATADLVSYGKRHGKGK